MNSIIDTLAAAEPHDIVRVTLLNGDQIEGEANPVEYVPEQSLYIGLHTEKGAQPTRYAIVSEFHADEWDSPQVRRQNQPIDEDRWVAVGEASEAAIIHRFREDQDRSGVRV